MESIDKTKILIEKQEEDNLYEKVRRRYTQFISRYTISDKEIIEKQEAEIDYYRHKIELLTKVHRENVEVIREQDKKIEELEQTDELEDKDVIEIISTTTYADGKPIQTTMKYKKNYKET